MRPLRPILPAPTCLIAAALSLAGCIQHDRCAFDDLDPAARLSAIRAAAATKDQAAIPDLIKSLDSDDPAERLLAGHTLEQITGKSFDYDHASPRPERDAAAERWKDWYASPNPAPQRP